jgi:hypothetical protein
MTGDGFAHRSFIKGGLAVGRWRMTALPTEALSKVGWLVGRAC